MVCLCSERMIDRNLVHCSTTDLRRLAAFLGYRRATIAKRETLIRAVRRLREKELCDEP